MNFLHAKKKKKEKKKKKREKKKKKRRKSLENSKVCPVVKAQVIHHLCKVTKAAAEKARKAWWSARAVGAEKHDWAAEQCGHGG